MALRENGAYYFPNISTANVADRLPRDVSDVEAALSYLLYHELAHANDFFDYTEWQQLSNSASPLSSYDDSFHFYGVNNFIASYVVTTPCFGRSSIRRCNRFKRKRNYTALQVANWFEDDGAVAFYSYFTEREDLAMLFERFMMLYRLQAEADVGVFTRETLEDGSFIPLGLRETVLMMITLLCA